MAQYKKVTGPFLLESPWRRSTDPSAVPGQYPAKSNLLVECCVGLCAAWLIVLRSVTYLTFFSRTSLKIDFWCTSSLATSEHHRFCFGDSREATPSKRCVLVIKGNTYGSEAPCTRTEDDDRHGRRLRRRLSRQPAVGPHGQWAAGRHCDGDGEPQQRPVADAHL